MLHSTILSACQYVGSTAPTVRSIRKAPLVLVCDPLDNHKIDFGVAHFALRCFPRWCARLTEPVLPTLARARWRHSSHPRSARDVSFGVSLCIHPHLCGLWFRVEYHPSPYPRTSAASAQSRLAQRLRSTRLMLLVLPALVVEPIFSENRRKRLALAPIGCNN